MREKQARIILICVMLHLLLPWFWSWNISCHNQWPVCACPISLHTCTETEQLNDGLFKALQIWISYHVAFNGEIVHYKAGRDHTWLQNMNVWIFSHLYTYLRLLKVVCCPIYCKYSGSKTTLTKRKKLTILSRQFKTVVLGRSMRQSSLEQRIKMSHIDCVNPDSVECM